MMADEFLKGVMGDEIDITVAGLSYSGELYAFDDRYIILADQEGMSMIRRKEITVIEWSPKIKAEVVANE